MAAGPEPVKGSVVAEEEPLETVSASSQSQFTLRVHTQRSHSEFTLRVHIQSSDSQIRLSSDSENQVKTQKSLATKAFPTVLRKEWVTKQLWLWRISVLRNWWPIVQVSHNWAAINFGNFKGEVSCDKSVASPHWTLASAIKTGAILCFAVSHSRQPFDGVLSCQWVNWKANEKTAVLFQSLVHTKRLWSGATQTLQKANYLVWFGFSRSWSSLIDCDCDCNKSGSEWNCESNNLWYDCKHGGDHNRGSDCSNECKVDCTRERKSWLRGRLLAIEALGPIGSGRWRRTKVIWSKTQLSDRAVT